MYSLYSSPTPPLYHLPIPSLPHTSPLLSFTPPPPPLHTSPLLPFTPSPLSQKNHYSKPDVALFDFTSIYQAEYAARAVCRRGQDLFLCLVGDALLEVCLLSSPLPSPPSLHTFVYSSTHHNQSSCSPHLYTHSSFMDVDLNFSPIFTQSHSLIRCNHLSPPHSHSGRQVRDVPEDSSVLWTQHGSSEDWGRSAVCWTS